MTTPGRPTVAVLGASGLIGFALAESLTQEGIAVRAIARRFTAAQEGVLGGRAIVSGVTQLASADLAALLAGNNADVVVNCIGVLQDGPRGGTQDVHVGFVGRLLEAVAAQARPVLLIHMSIPGRQDDDRTAFSRSKREAERIVAGSGLPFIVLRPGFVVAPAAYGGSALLRVLAVLPIGLPSAISRRPFAITAIGDLTRTIVFAAQAWQTGERSRQATWDVAAPGPTVETVIDAFRLRLGGPATRAKMPFWLLRAGARVGDAAARLGWVPPVRTTALREMERGVDCDPTGWMKSTGLTPTSLNQTVEVLPVSVQERWFARLFLLKPLVIGGLALFWIASGLIALTVAFRPATGILVAHGFPPRAAGVITAVSSLVDVAIGCAIALRKTCRPGLWAGIAVSTFYMASAVLFTPDMWVEPLGALVKTGPAIVLMAVALAILDDR